MGDASILAALLQPWPLSQPDLHATDCQCGDFYINDSTRNNLPCTLEKKPCQGFSICRQFSGEYKRRVGVQDIWIIPTAETCIFATVCRGSFFLEMWSADDWADTLANQSKPGIGFLCSTATERLKRLISAFHHTHNRLFFYTHLYFCWQGSKQQNFLENTLTTANNQKDWLLCVSQHSNTLAGAE